MIIRRLLSALALFAVALPLNAAAPPNADRQDIVYIGPDGPVRMRLHVQIDGLPASQRWQAYVDRVFKHFDADGNGSLSDKEFARLAAFPFVGATGTRDLPLVTEADDPPGSPRGLRFAVADRDKDSKVTIEELRAVLKQYSLGAVNVNVLPRANDAVQTTDALLKHLDADKDGRLSKDECAAALGVLAKLDLNEDEIVSREELLEAPVATTGRTRPKLAELDEELADPEGRRDFIPFTPSDTPGVALQIIRRFDKNKNDELVSSEWPIDTKLFAAIDQDANKKISITELAEWLTAGPDIEFRVMMGNRRGIVNWLTGLPGSPIAVWPPRPDANSLTAKVRRDADASLRLELPGAAIAVSEEGAMLELMRGSQLGFLREQFKMLVGDKKSIERRQLREKPELQQFDPFFASADRNGDGKLGLEEFSNYVDLVEQGTNKQVGLTISDSGRGLLELLDTDRDGRLSVRELRNVWKIMSACDAKGEGKIGIDQLPQRYEVRPHYSNVASAEFGLRFANETNFTTRTTSTRGRAGPEWFRKLDRNTDGDVSAKEFLGPPELFRKLDADGDGLISLEEALAADKRTTR